MKVYILRMYQDRVLVEKAYLGKPSIEQLQKDTSDTISPYKYRDLLKGFVEETENNRYCISACDVTFGEANT